MEAMQRTIIFYHDRDIDKLKLGYTLPNLANNCLHKSIDTKFYSIMEAEKHLLKKIRKAVVGCFSIVFTCNAVVDETFIRMSTNICKSNVGIDGSQLYPYSTCQPMPNGLYPRWDLDPQTSRFTLRQNKTRSLEIEVKSFFQRTIPDCKIESFYTTDRQLTTDCFSVDGFCCHCHTVFEAMGCFYQFCCCQEVCLSLIEDDINMLVKTESSMKWGEARYQKKAFTVIELWGVTMMETVQDKQQWQKHIRERFLHRRSLAAQQLLEKIKT